METLPVVGYDAARKEHRPLLLGGECIPVENVPVSTYPGNLLIRHADGLYYGGNSMPPLLYIDTDLGVDGPFDSHGSATTLKTLDYALQAIETLRPKSVTLLLRAGQTFNITKNYSLRDVDLVISYYQDPKYGTANQKYLTSTIAPQLQADLLRPTIRSQTFQADSGFWGMRHLRVTGGSVKLQGLKIELPDTPVGTTGLVIANYAAASDLIVGANTMVETEGVVINKQDKTSMFGFLGISSRSRVTYSQFATQFKIENKLVGFNDQNIASALLQSRPYFIKFYPDTPTSNSFLDYASVVATSVGTTDGCGLLTLMWLLCSSWDDPISGSESIQTWPLADYLYGISRYIYGIRRDQQSRPLNVTSSVLL